VHLKSIALTRDKALIEMWFSLEIPLTKENHDFVREKIWTRLWLEATPNQASIEWEAPAENKQPGLELRLVDRKAAAAGDDQPGITPSGSHPGNDGAGDADGDTQGAADGSGDRTTDSGGEKS
jgi:hypothetical protein